MQWNEWMVQAIFMAASAGLGAYGAVRAELAVLRVKVEQAGREAERANRRLDALQ